MTAITHANRFSPVQPQLEIERKAPNYTTKNDVIKRIALSAIICFASFLVAPQAYAIRFSLTLSMLTFARVFSDCIRGIDSEPSRQSVRISPSLQPLTTPVHSEECVDSGPPAPRPTITHSNHHHRRTTSSFRRTPGQFQTLRRPLSRDEIVRAASLPPQLETLDHDDLNLRRDDSALAAQAEISEPALPETLPPTPATSSPESDMHVRIE